jgi:hypothetical protein
MKQLLRAILSELDERRPAMLATIIGRSGSAPRGAGTAMAVLQNGEMTGTVGGGTVEYRAKLDALALMQKHACDVREYEIRADEKGVRSGSVRILFRSFDGETGRALVRQILDCIESGEEAFLVCQLAGAKDGSFVTGGGEVCAKTGLYGLPARGLCRRRGKLFHRAAFGRTARAAICGACSAGYGAPTRPDRLPCLDD